MGSNYNQVGGEKAEATRRFARSPKTLLLLSLIIPLGNRSRRDGGWTRARTV